MPAIKNLLLVAFLQTSLLVVQGQSKAATEVLTPVKQLIVQIRAGQDAQVWKQLDMGSISKYLLGDYIGKATAQQRNEFTALFQSLFTKIAFPRIRDNFKELSGITYEPAEIKGNEATVGSTIFIRHPLKQQEMKLKYRLIKVAKGWQVKDVAVLGDSMMENIRNDQVQPLLKEGGIEHLLEVMRKM